MLRQWSFHASLLYLPLIIHGGSRSMDSLLLRLFVLAEYNRSCLCLCSSLSVSVSVGVCLCRIRSIWRRCDPALFQKMLVSCLAYSHASVLHSCTTRGGFQSILWISVCVLSCVPQHTGRLCRGFHPALRFLASLRRLPVSNRVMGGSGVEVQGILVGGDVIMSGYTEGIRETMLPLCTQRDGLKTAWRLAFPVAPSASARRISY